MCRALNPHKQDAVFTHALYLLNRESSSRVRRRVSLAPDKARSCAVGASSPFDPEMVVSPQVCRRALAPAARLFQSQPGVIR